MRIPVLAAALACAAWGQTPERVFHFTFTESPQAMQEIVNGLRSILEIQQAKVDSAERTLTMAGTADQMAAATFLFPELDKPNGAKEYRLSDARWPVVRIFYLKSTPTPQGMQELVNAIRSVLEVQRIVVINANRAILLRGSEDQAAGAEWMIQSLDRAPGTETGPVLSFTVREPEPPPGVRIVGHSPAARIFYLGASQTPQGMQEIVSAVRTVGEILRAVMVQGPRALVIRGTAEQAAMAEWLVGALATPGVSTPFNLASTGEVARVFKPAPASEQIADVIRSEAKIQRVWLASGNRAIVVRGTVGQVAVAERLIQEK